MDSSETPTANPAENEAGLTVFRYKLKPLRDHQHALIQQSLGCQRWVYNQGVALQEKRLETGKRRLPYKDLCSVLKRWKTEHDWLGSAPSQSLQQTLAGLSRGYQAWRQSPEHFDKPTFKKKSQRRESLTFPTPSHITWDPARGRVTMPKFGQLRYFKDKRVPDGALRRVTLSRDGNDLVVCFTVKSDTSTGRTPADIALACGIDLGVVNRVALDDGSVFTFPEDQVGCLDQAITQTSRWIAHKVEMRKQYTIKIPATLKAGGISGLEQALLEAELARRGESQTLMGLRAKLRKLHQRKRHLLNNTRHQITSRIARTYHTVYVEDLKVKNMTASAKGTVEKPGKNVRQKSGLNRQMLLTAPGALRRQLEYKTARHGGKVVAIHPAYSSLTCPVCDHAHQDNRPTRDRFACTHCAFTAPADQVGAINVRRWGQAETHLAVVKPYKTRPALISRKPRKTPVPELIHHSTPPALIASG